MTNCQQINQIYQNQLIRLYIGHLNQNSTFMGYMPALVMITCEPPILRLQICFETICFSCLFVFSSQVMQQHLKTVHNCFQIFPNYYCSQFYTTLHHHGIPRCHFCQCCVTLNPVLFMSCKFPSILCSLVVLSSSFAMESHLFFLPPFIHHTESSCHTIVLMHTVDNVFLNK